MMQRAEINKRMQDERKRDNGHYVLSEKKIKENKDRATKKCLAERRNRNSLSRALNEITGFCKEVYRG